MADVLLPSSPLAPGVSPVRIHYRDAGEGPPIAILHGGWGYDVYPFDRQIGALSPRYRIVIPDRTGYGGSRPIDVLPTDFHQRAAEETCAVIDALGLERPVLWGHSDGAIIALLLGLAAPDRISGAIVEASHYFKRKPGSRTFSEAVAAKPRSKFLETHSRTWLRIAEEAAPGEDFYGGRLSEFQSARLVIHGARDPRTEPGEFEAMQAALSLRREDGGQVPHRQAQHPRDIRVLADAAHPPMLELEGVSRHFDAPDGRSDCVLEEVSLAIPAGAFVALGLTLGGIARPEANARADGWLARVGLAAFATHYPSQLSGGMRKRVAMAQNWIIDRRIARSGDQGVRDADRVIIDNVRVLGASEQQLMRHVLIPSALTWIFSSLQTSLGFVMVGAVVGEYLGATRGLGYVISQAEGTFDATGVFAGMTVLALVVMIVSAGVSRLERWLLRWK